MRDTIEIDGLTFGVTLEPDTDAGFPWDNMDTLGTVSDWVRRDKAPGERVLLLGRSGGRFYDYARAVAKARSEGLKGPDAADAADKEFAYLQAWCNDRLQYIRVVVTLLDVEGNPTDESDALWGVDDDGDYAKKCAYDLALGLASRTVNGYARNEAQVAHYPDVAGLAI